MTAGVVAVTGGSGFVGARTLRPLLKRGYEVHAMGRRAPAVPGVTFHPVDLFDERRMRAVLHAVRPTHLLHAAWFVGHGRYWTALENEAWQAASLALAEAALAAGAQRLVGVGSAAEYDWSDGGSTARTEDDDTHAATPYGRAKAATGHAWAALCAAHGASFGWARLFHLYGPGEPPGKLVAATASALLEGLPARLGPGGLARDFLHVQDAGRALAALVDAGLQGPMNVASGSCVSVAHVAGLLGQLTGRPDLLMPGALPARETDAPRMAADVRRLRLELGFTPWVPLAEGLAGCVAALRAVATAAATPRTAEEAA